MRPSSKESSNQSSLENFRAFLKNEWSKLAGISVFFPGSAEITRYILTGNSNSEGTYEDGISSQLVVIIATLCTMFVIYNIYNQRDEMKNQIPKSIRSKATSSFIQGFFCLLFYLAAYNGIYYVIYEPLGIWHGNFIRTIGDIVLLLLYTASFTLITRSFTLLGMSEFLKQQREVKQKR